MHVYHLPHPLPLPLSGQPLTHQGRVVVENLSVLGPIEDVQTLKQLKGHLVQMAISAMPPIMVSSTRLHYFAAVIIAKSNTCGCPVTDNLRSRFVDESLH